ncbi:hypothetical protein BAE44_0010668, partial [Dichanthelium oligosanthes]
LRCNDSQTQCHYVSVEEKLNLTISICLPFQAGRVAIESEVSITLLAIS